MNLKSSPGFIQIRGAALALALAASLTGHAATVVETLPYSFTPAWTNITFANTTMELNQGGGSSTLTTAPGNGVWFGYGVWYGNEPPWRPGSSAQGNHLALDASFSNGAADWSASFFDQTSYAAFIFAPTTGCDYAVRSCYGAPAESGIRVYHANGTDATAFASTFVNMDLTQRHSFEFLLKNGQVAYRVDGNVVYSGLAYAANPGAPLLVIGDGSGSSLTGEGAMTIYRVSFDNAPLGNTLAPVPEPDTWILWLGGFLMLGTAMRRHRVLNGIRA